MSALPPRPRIAVIVPTGDPSRYPASRCLEVLKETTSHLDVEVHTIVSSGPGFSFAKSINRGLHASADAHAWVLLNDDAFMDAGWLDAMIAAARAHPEVGLWGGVLRYPEGGIQHAGGRLFIGPGEFLAQATRHKAPLWALRNIARRRLRLHPYMAGHHHAVSRTNRLDFLTGACLFITKECRARIGELREQYVFGSEDADYALRTLEAGLEIGLALRATGIHLETATAQALTAKAKLSHERLGSQWTGQRIAELTRGRLGVYAE